MSNSHQTLALSELPIATDAKEGDYVTFWCSDDGQSDMLMGWGPTEFQSEADARLECTKQGIKGDDFRTFLII